MRQAMRRTTITLDPDTHALIQQAMKERGISFKSAVNDAIRRGLKGGENRAPWTFPTYEMGEYPFDATKALSLAFAMDDEKYFGSPSRDGQAEE